MEKRQEKGFTLIEILIVVAIIAILAGVVLVSATAYRSRARSARAQAQASSALPSMVSCAANKGWGSVNGPSGSGGGYICGSDSNYGLWPDMSPISFSYGNWNASAVNSFYFTVGGGGITICCNSAMNSCGAIDSGSCNPSRTW